MQKYQRATKKEVLSLNNQYNDLDLDLIEAKDFAAILEISVSNFNKCIREKKIPRCDRKIGQSRVWKKENVYNFLKNHYEEIERKHQQKLENLKGGV